MTAPPPRRPWWKRKRVGVAAAVWLAVTYPLSLGPMNYAQGRGWIGPSANAAMQTFYDPLVYLAVHEIPPGPLILAYADLFGDLAARQAASE